jgi:hypothetical protein
MTRPWQGVVGESFTPEEFQNYCDAWAANLEGDAWKPEFVVLHNTQLPTYEKPSNDVWRKGPNGINNIRALEHFYQNVKGWSAGPHLFVADLIWVFTPLTVHGVHSPSWNEITWGVESVGDYDTEEFADPVRENVISALKSLHQASGIDPVTLKLHREDPLTEHACPGKNIIKSEIVREVADRL